MNLSFSERWPDGSKTYFIHRIWRGLNLDCRQHDNYLSAYHKKFGTRWDYVRRINPKIHTIRFMTPKRAEQWTKWVEAEQKIHFIINARSKDKRFQFAPNTVPVTGIEKIGFLRPCRKSEKDPGNILIAILPLEYYSLSYKDRMQTITYGVLDDDVTKKLAINDGFDSLEGFGRYFSNKKVKEYADVGKYPYLIHWTDCRYGEVNSIPV